MARSIRPSVAWALRPTRTSSRRSRPCRNWRLRTARRAKAPAERGESRPPGKRGGGWTQIPRALSAPLPLALHEQHGDGAQQRRRAEQGEYVDGGHVLTNEPAAEEWGDDGANRPHD